MSGARNLHRIAGALHRMRKEAATGSCGIGKCSHPAFGFIEGWTGRPVGVCAGHADEAERRGYTVYTLEDIGESA
jgi:hypothetical protein